MLIRVTAHGRLSAGARTYRCALGRAGISQHKTEGDGATPAGSWPLRRVLYRPDRLPPPATALPVSALGPKDGWCDAPGDPAYNQPVTLPYPASAEPLWRDDSRYDVIVVLGYNDDPVTTGKGSAIFFHIAAPDYTPTEGCVAVALADMIDILALCSADSRMVIQPPTP